MSYKIYTYGDPYRLNKTSFWNKIKQAPHLCSSQVMVNAFRDLFENYFDSLLCPIDNVLKVTYSDWFNNIEKRITQYIAISTQMEMWKKNDYKNRDELYASLKHNQGELLDAIRLFVELGINVDDLDGSQANLEQKVFLSILDKICNPQSPLFEPFFLQNDYTIEDLVRFFRITITEVISREESESTLEIMELEKGRRVKRINQLNKILASFSADNLKSVVIHGIHQFTPLQLRFIKLLDKLGVEVILLYNYQHNYKEIYSTWDNLYQLFGVPIEHDTALGSYKSKYLSNSHNLAKAFGQLLESSTQHNAQDRLEWYKCGQQVEMIAFDNITEYAGFVSNYYDKALAITENSKKATSLMSERVYTAGREVHDLLRIYYPEQSSDRHFLCYPIGQFFLGLYRMWDSQSSQLIIDWDCIKECLMAGIIRVAHPEKLISILEVTSTYFEDVKTYEQYVERMVEYKKQYKSIQSMQNEIGEQLRRISFYRKGIISLEDIENIEFAVSQLNEIASHLFTLEKGGLLSFARHFQKLEEFIRNELINMVEEEEKKLVESLLERFEQVNNNTPLSGTMEDLKSGLYFYLKQKEEESPQWIVRNFVQIEGDILHSRSQSDCTNREEKQPPVYHFACLSDRMLNQTIDDLLPWPLTDYFIRKAYSPVSLIFQLYYSSLGERGKFLRYALFYGLCYNECAVRLSYVVHAEDEVEQPYFPLRMLGIKPVPYLEKEVVESLPTINASTSNSSIVVGHFGMMDFFLCPYKYYLDMVCRDEIVIDNAFMLKRYYSNMLVYAVWSKMQEKPKMNNTPSVIQNILKSTQKLYQQYFPFYREANDLHDMMRVAENYINHILWQGNVMKRYDELHMKVRFLFQKAKYFSGDLTSHPYTAFEQRTVVTNGEKVFSLHKIRSRGEIALLQAIQKYMKNKDGEAIAGDWCNYCSHRNTCLEPFRVEISTPVSGGE